MIQFLEAIITQFKEITDENQHFYELKQCQKNNWIQNKKNGSCELTLRRLLRRENLNSTFSSSYIKMTKPFDGLDDFKKIKFFRQHRQWIIFWGQIQNGSFVTVETVTFQLRSSAKHLFGFNHSNYVIKTDFFSKKEQSYVLLQQQTKLS